MTILITLMASLGMLVSLALLIVRIRQLYQQDTLQRSLSSEAQPDGGIQSDETDELADNLLFADSDDEVSAAKKQLDLESLSLHRQTASSAHPDVSSNAATAFLTGYASTRPSLTGHSLAERDDFGKVDWMSKAQIFTGIQLLDAKRRGLSLANTSSQGCVDIAAAYLIGAAQVITFQLDGDEQNALDVAAFLLTHNLHMDAMDIQDALQQAAYGDATMASFNKGKEAAAIWIVKKFVPDALSLYNTVSTAAFV